VIPLQRTGICLVNYIYIQRLPFCFHHGSLPPSAGMLGSIMLEYYSTNRTHNMPMPKMLSAYPYPTVAMEILKTGSTSMFTTKLQNIDRFSCSIVSATRLYGRDGRRGRGGERGQHVAVGWRSVSSLERRKGERNHSVCDCVCLFLLCYFS
jgi:hypothetical protein